MFQTLLKDKNSGFIFLEIIIAVALIGIVFITLLSVGFSALSVSSSVQKQIRADFLAKEELEALRNFRDGTTWATNGLGVADTGSANPYHLVNNSGNWTLISGPEIMGNSPSDFTRQVVLDKVSRTPGINGNDIEEIYNPSHDDPDTRKITVTIQWSGRSMEVFSYMTNWKE